MGKVVTAFLYKHKFLFLISNEHKFWNLSNVSDGNLKQDIKKMCFNCLKFQTVLILGTTMASTMTGLAPFLVNDKELPLGTMHSLESRVLSKTNFVLQEIVVMLYIFPICSFDAIFTGACIKIAMQFRILSDVFRNMDFENNRKGLVTAVEHHMFLLE